MYRTALGLVDLPVYPLMVDRTVVSNLASATPSQPFVYSTYTALVLEVTVLLYDHIRCGLLLIRWLQIVRETVRTAAVTHSSGC